MRRAIQRAPARVSQSFAVQFTMLRGMEETTQEDEAQAATDSVRAGRLSSDAPRRRRLFVMRAAGAHRLFAVYADEVEATSENPTMPTPLPFAPAPVRGVGSLRGRILTVIDPLLLLPHDAATSSAAPTPDAHTRASLIVALKGDEQLALAVESVEHELELFDDETNAATDTSNNLPLRRTIRHRAGDILLLDPARLFDAAMQGVERRRRRQ